MVDNVFTKIITQNNMFIEDIIVAIITTILVFALIIGYTIHEDTQRSKIQYCFNSQGEHFVAPNPNCTH